MADLSAIEKRKLEKFLHMKDGYVLNFSNRTFQEFVLESVERDIYDQKYDNGSGSKANRLRAFWDREPNHVVGKLLKALEEYWSGGLAGEYYQTPDSPLLAEECRKIAGKLLEGKVVEHIDVIKGTDDDKDYKLLATSIRDSIEKNQPEAALDRLHTFVFKFIRKRCDEHQLQYSKDESLNAVFGKYIKHLLKSQLIESPMAEKILRYSISIIEAFNDVRNNKSFAHDNPVLNYDESILIFNNVTNAIKFIESLEVKLKAREQKKQQASETDWLEF